MLKIFNKGDIFTVHNTQYVVMGIDETRLKTSFCELYSFEFEVFKLLCSYAICRTASSYE